MGLRLAMEVLNRYEAHLLNTAAQALEFVVDVGADNVGLLLDAYHMNIEEADPATWTFPVCSALSLAPATRALSRVSLCRCRTRTPVRGRASPSCERWRCSYQLSAASQANSR